MTTSVLLFEDVQENRETISSALRSELNDEGTVECFLGDQDLQDVGSYERCIEGFLQSGHRLETIGLIACDKELGLYENYRGLSANAVSAVARNLGIPFCQYSRNPGGDVRELERFRRLRLWDSEDITLDGDDSQEWVKEIAGLYRGFSRIARFYRDHPDAKKMKPARALASITEHPDCETRIALYGSGDQSVLTEIFAFLDDSSARERTVERMPRIMGTWLLLSLLRFPGLLVNQVAAASFLNVSVADFARPEVRSVFESASYTGPFCELGSWWWREDLEEMIIEAELQDGRELLSQAAIEVDECLDAKGHRAGYFCMITGKPVSRGNSTGDINWFPSGADLSRIENDKFDEITSLVSV